MSDRSPEAEFAYFLLLFVGGLDELALRLRTPLLKRVVGSKGLRTPLLVLGERVGGSSSGGGSGGGTFRS